MIPGQPPSTSVYRRQGASPGGEASAPWPADAWQRELKRSVRSGAELLRILGLGQDRRCTADPDFPVRVPRPYIDRMRRGDADDPLLRQVLPSLLEDEPAPGFGDDALAEADAMVDTGLMQKYAGRALLIASGTCAVNCRYCFRRHFPYAEHRQAAAFPALAAVRRDASIRELILSGGDPLMLNDNHFAGLVAQIQAIGHVARLRVHTRTPVVIPQRVTAELIETLRRTRQRVVIVLHFNHPREIDDDCRRAMRALAEFTLLNQSVLLHGVNDDADTLAELSERLFDAGVLPYYLHMPDRVAGTAHFHVDDAPAVAIHRALASKLPGYLVPRLVRERPGATAKELLCP